MNTYKDYIYDKFNMILDIYFATLEDGDWSEAVNIGLPINSKERKSRIAELDQLLNEHTAAE